MEKTPRNPDDFHVASRLGRETSCRQVLEASSGYYYHHRTACFLPPLCVCVYLRQVGKQEVVPPTLRLPSGLAFLSASRHQEKRAKRRRRRSTSRRSQAPEIFICVFIKASISCSPPPRTKMKWASPAPSLLHHYGRWRSCPLQFGRRRGCSRAKCISAQLLFLLLFVFFFLPFSCYTPIMSHTHTQHKLLLCNMTFSLISC